MPEPLTPAKLAAIKTLSESGTPVRAIARAVGVGRGRVVNALARGVDRVRDEKEFNKGGGAFIKARRHDLGQVSWDLQAIANARDAQLSGSFQAPVALAKAMRTDGALYVAYCARLAPQSAVQSRVVSKGGARADAVRRKALASVFVSPSELKSIQGTMANHGVGIGQVLRTTSNDGSRVDCTLKEWPLEHVRWNNSEEQLQTTDRDGVRHNIVHGDGDWVIFRKHHELPWTQEACVLPAALLWAMHANAGQDWAGASRSHGQAKVVGELPGGVALQTTDAQGNVILTPEALGFLSILQNIVSGDAGAGLRPAGSKTEFLSNGSTAWQVFSELMNNAEKIAARIYLGTDAILGSVGGAPGVDISTLFGVASTILQGDFAAIEQALNTGVYEPWTAINYGDSSYAPRFEYQLPDPDSEEKSDERSKKLTRLLDAAKRYYEQGFKLDQNVVDQLAKDFDVDNVPSILSIMISIDPKDVARVTRVWEARAAIGLPPLGDSRDQLFLGELVIQQVAADAQFKKALAPDAPADPEPSALAKLSAGLSAATPPAYLVGTRVEALVDHMPGMKGMQGVVSIANAGAPPYYGITFDGTTDVHKWLAENEIAPA